MQFILLVTVKAGNQTAESMNISLATSGSCDTIRNPELWVPWELLQQTVLSASFPTQLWSGTACIAHRKIAQRWDVVQQQIKSQSERRENTGTSETSEEGRKKRSPQPGSLFLWFSILLSRVAAPVQERICTYCQTGWAIPEPKCEHAGGCNYLSKCNAWQITAIKAFKVPPKAIHITPGR